MRNKRILKNTLALYSRQIVIVLINLYALRVVLNALGVGDFGIYTAVAGFVTLLSFLPGTMASATQRFFAYAIGQQDDLKLKQTFSVNWVLYLAIGLIALLLLQTIGLWFVTEELNLPTDRRLAALHVYQLVALGFVASILASPFIAILIAHEDMHLYALVSVIEAVLKLGAAMLLSRAAGDVLVLYAGFLLITALITTTIYIGICLKKYAECQFRKIHWDRAQLKETLDFTGWTLFGQLTTVFRNQAVTVLINQLFNPATVAARAIALTVAGQAMVFSQNLNTGLYPPIIKSYAADQKDEMFNLILNGSKLTFFLMWVFALPMMLEMEAILTLWLATPPPEAVLFTQLALVESLILSFSLPLATAARAPGKMKLYELSLGSIQVAIFGASWAVLEAGYPAYAVFIVAIIANLLMFKVRLLLVKGLIGLPMTPYYLKVLYPLGIVTLLSATPALLLKQWTTDGLLGSAAVVMVSVIGTTLFTYYFGLDKAWRTKIKALILLRVAGKGANA
ncbi:MATE family efflux transporter [Stutzerimonas xanthomarina]|uniref:Membrane protein involved in the export of O-antigen and teichoic acid n=2 Tax=Stutzerimonas xanthomarina TaxID=271420 RepID=A0A1M5P7H2_9GAMM|nr:MATE family efflux transporter [Stutzerimonas xanthomarina]MCP9338555.1 MATE family efflux transporter [Stutzerimonas xanthomarina]SEH77265.1 Membrane protein involved in the export of O-antigen and teichoic acid [Stutzerimonas xanthomarina]SHG97637.1 Membrane protein involved in the export of O-antigen and teichoic acid [Stutzerimonas xanthomarina DSM 18231]